jgi:hypothetical protein
MTHSNYSIGEKKLELGTVIDKKFGADDLVSVLQCLDKMEYNALFVLLNSTNAISTKMVMKKMNQKSWFNLVKENFEGSKRLNEVFDIVDSNDFQRLTEKEIYEKIKKVKEKFPKMQTFKPYSFYAVQNSIKSLYDMGFLGRREVSFKRADELWFVNPNFRKVWLNLLKTRDKGLHPMVENILYGWE